MAEKKKTTKKKVTKKPTKKKSKAHKANGKKALTRAEKIELRIAKNKVKILGALEDSMGIVTNACVKSKISNYTFYRWYNSDDEFAKAVDEIQNVFDIIVEDKLKKKIIEDDGHSIRFYLGHRVKKYRRSLELSTDDEEPLNITIKTYEEPKEKK